MQRLNALAKLGLCKTSYYPDFCETRPFPGTAVEVRETPSSVVNEITPPSHSLVFEIRDNLTLRLSHGVTIAPPI